MHLHAGMPIIAAMDLSPASLNAARSAVALARVLRERLLLVQAIQPTSAVVPDATMIGVPDLDECVWRAAEEALENVRSALAVEAPDVAIEKRLVLGRPPEALSQLASEESARLIVMGTLGRSAGGRLLVGSVAEGTIRESARPVLVLREGAAPFGAWASGQRPLRVVAGLARSASAEAALAFVSQLRAAAACDVTLVHEYWPPGEYARLGLRGPRDVQGDDPEVVAALEDDLRDQLQLGGGGQVALRIRAAWGPVGAQLAMEAQADGADLLVLGSDQPHGLDRLRRGSAALSALHTTELPVLVVPVGHDAARAPADALIPLVRSVLVATDLSDLGNAAIPHAYALCGHRGGRVELCHVHERPRSAPAYVLPDRAPGLSAGERRDLERRLTNLVPRQAAELGISSQVTVVDGGHVPEEILAAASRSAVDAIVIASHGRGGLGRALFGSIAEAVLRRSGRPVYVVRPPGGRT